jgi:hypothetical protein
VGDPQVILIGPVCAGKSTLAPLTADLLDLQAIDLDLVAAEYYDEAGVGIQVFREKAESDGFLSAYRWWQRGFPHAVRRVLQDYPRAVISLGAGHTHCRSTTSKFEVHWRVISPFLSYLRPIPIDQLKFFGAGHLQPARGTGALVAMTSSSLGCMTRTTMSLRC